MTQQSTASSLKRKTHFSYRVSPKVAFLGEVAARIVGQSFATYVERLVYRDIEATKSRTGRPIDEYWDEHEGVSWCAVFVDQVFPLDDDEDRVREFVMAHTPFFYVRHGKRLEPNRRAVHTLWPDIDRLVDDWHKRRQIDAWAVGERMAKTLKAAKVPVPEWGPGADDL